MKIKPLTTDPAAMIRDGYHEPERVFPPPPIPVLEGKLDDRAFEMLELVVWVWRISQHDQRLRNGVDWAVLQRWYDVGNSVEMRQRIYAALAYLAAEGYLREVGRTKVPVHPGLTSDHFVPTDKAFQFVDSRQASVVTKLLRTIPGSPLIKAIFAIVGGLASLLAILRWVLDVF